MKNKKMSLNEFSDILCKELEKQKLYISKDKIDKLYKYMELLIEWNEKMNLTAITDEYEIIVKHFVDCLLCTKAIKEEKTIIDVGTGAGFPGLVLAIYYPDKEFTLIDALNKRLIFLQEVIDRLNIVNVELIHGRAEEIVRINKLYEKYDVSVSRAVAQLPILLEYTSPYVKVNGKCIVMKGDNIEEEISLSSNALSELKMTIDDRIEYSYIVNNEKYNRNILSIKKLEKTPSKYPRNYGKIKKKPL